MGVGLWMQQGFGTGMLLPHLCRPDEARHEHIKAHTIGNVSPAEKSVHVADVFQSPVDT